MIRNSSTAFRKDTGRFQDNTARQSVTVTRDRCAREVLSIEDFTDADIEAVRRMEPSKEAEAFNDELDG